jgi:hypothetical protein
VRLTLLLEPFRAITETVDAPEAPWGMLSDEGVSPRVKLGEGATISISIVQVAVSDPEVPVIVTKVCTRAAVLLAVRVSTLVPVVGFGANDAVTPLGRPEAASVTLPVNPG